MDSLASPALQCGDDSKAAPFIGVVDSTAPVNGAALEDQDKKLAVCERLMVQGVTRIVDLVKLLGISKRKALAIRAKILQEWEEIASSAGSAASRGRFFRKAETVERTAWSLFSEEESAEKKANLLKLILSAIEKEVAILGLSAGKETDEHAQSPEKLFDCERKVESIIGTLEKSCGEQSAL